MAESTERPQDAGRRHRRRGNPSPATAALLTRFHAAMRDDLGALLEELAPVPVDRGLLDEGKPDPPPKRLPIAERSKRWDLAIKLAGALGGEIDPAPMAPDATPARRGRRAKPEW